MRNDGRTEQRVEPLERHHVLAELDVGVGFEKLAALRRVIIFVARDEFHLDARALAQDAAVFGRRLEFREVHAHLAAEIKAVEVARRRQEAGVEDVRRRLARLRHGPDGIGKLVMLVVGILFGEKKFHLSADGHGFQVLAIVSKRVNLCLSVWFFFARSRIFSAGAAASS